MGGSQSKDVDQTLTLLINKTYGTKMVYIPFKSGSEAATQLAGKHIAANVNNPSENISQWRAGQVKPLCVFSKTRMSYTTKMADQAWSDIATCKEQGLAIDEYRFPRTVFMPGGVSCRPAQVLRQPAQARHPDAGVRRVRRTQRAGADLPRRRRAGRATSRPTKRAPAASSRMPAGVVK